MKRFWTSCVTLLVILFTSCDSDILDYPDPNSKSVDDYFKTPDEIQMGAIGIYSAFFHNNAFVWQLPEMFDGLANEFDGRPASTGETDIQAIRRYQHSNTTQPITSYWRVLYRIILRSNLVLFKAEQYSQMNGADPKVTLATGDAYFLRGWAYTQLAFHWGSVPLRVTYLYEGNGDSPRVAADEIWRQAEIDLKLAQQILPEQWPAEFLGRATRGAATGFLGKLYLYNEKYADAEAQFSKLESRYRLLPATKWDDNFGETDENNEESVFEIQCSNIPGTDPYATMFNDPEESDNPGRQNGHAQLYSWTDFANWSFQKRRVDDFSYRDENGVTYVDPRAPLTFYGGVGDQTWCDKCDGGPRPFDFAAYGYWYRKSTNKENKPSEDAAHSGNNIRLMRYADVLLMRAECHIKMGDVSGGLDFINRVRARIGAFTYNLSYSHDEAFDLLKRERQVELMGEQSRYNDLKRWKILQEVMNVELQAMFQTPNVREKHKFFPIPQLEVDTNREFGVVKDSWN